MKKVFVLGLVFILSMAIATVALAAMPAPGGPFSSAFTIQNLTSGDVKCSFTLYDSTGGVAYTSPQVTIAAGDSVDYYVPGIAGVATGQYSAVISCDGAVAAVTNFSDPNSGASHSGVSEPGTEFYAPGIYDNYYQFYSNIVVQNATAAAQDITVEIYEPGNATAVWTNTATAVPAYTSVSFEQEGLTELANNNFYSAKIIGVGGDIAAIVNIYGRAQNDNQLYSYNPFSQGATTMYAPVIMADFYGYNTALVIQNMDTTDAQVTVTYTSGHTENHTIPPGAPVSLYNPATPTLAKNNLYSAKVESTNGKKIVALVNESNVYNRAASYSGFAQGSTTVVTPILMKRYFKYNTSITCQNVGTNPTTMTLTYSGIATSSVSPSIAAGGTHLFYQPGEAAITDGWIGSGTIIADAGEPIVCVVNEDQNEGPEAVSVMDQLFAYNGMTP